MEMLNIDSLRAIIDDAQSIVLTVHVNPDGDAIGSMLGMYEALLQQGKNVQMVVDSPVPHKFSFLKYADRVQPPEALQSLEQPDILLVLDASTFERIGKVGEVCKAPIYNIDHHISNTKFAAGLYLVPEFAATGEIVAHLCEQWHWPITPSMADALYLGIATDCGFFKFSNTTEHTLRMAALCVQCGARPQVVSEHVELTSMNRLAIMRKALANVEFPHDGRVGIIALDEDLMALAGDDTDGYVDLVRNVEGVDIAVLLKAVGPKTTRVSLRSKATDVNQIAGHFGGGGHIRAAGCTIQLPLEAAKAELLKELP